jgi:hypothetical protein
MISVGAEEPSFGDDAVRYLFVLLGITAAAAIVIIGIWAAIHVIRQPSYRDLIGEWCVAHQMRLVDLERRYLRAGPFFLSPNGTAVFYVTVSDALGNEKHLWARCGHWIFGMLVPQLLIREAD